MRSYIAFLAVLSVAAQGSPRLRVTNLCQEVLWLDHSTNIQEPARGAIMQPGSSLSIVIPDGKVPATRFWAKQGCSAEGLNCSLGESDEPCGPCQPPIQTKLEATWADIAGCAGRQDAECLTWINLSAVDGYSLPAKVTFEHTGAEVAPIDASGLSLAECPSGEDFSWAGRFAESHVDLRYRGPDGRVLGCFSPCKKANWPAPVGLGLPEKEEPAAHLCCPTPPITSEECRNPENPFGVVSTGYVRALGRMAPTIYSYAYQDLEALRTVPADTRVELTFCP